MNVRADNVASLWADFRRDLQKPPDECPLKFMFGHAGAPGVWTAEAYHPDCPFPLAVAWVRTGGRATIELLYISVFEHVRRCGLATKLHASIAAGFPDKERIITCNASDTAAPWMNKLGYTKCADGYQYLIPDRS